MRPDTMRMTTMQSGKLAGLAFGLLLSMHAPVLAHAGHDDDAPAAAAPGRGGPPGGAACAPGGGGGARAGGGRAGATTRSRCFRLWALCFPTEWVERFYYGVQSNHVLKCSIGCLQIWVRSAAIGFDNDGQFGTVYPARLDVAAIGQLLLHLFGDVMWHRIALGAWLLDASDGGEMHIGFILCHCTRLDCYRYGYTM